ncbi:MAG TPA: hypothetical protein VGF67_25635 [Ktedonobacteraceae bacterium]
MHFQLRQVGVLIFALPELQQTIWGYVCVTTTRRTVYTDNLWF